MRIVSNYLLGDPGLTGAFGLFCGTARYENVIAVIEDDHDIQTYENYYTAISSYFEGLWNKPIFVNESNFVESEDDLEVPVRLIYNSFVGRKPIKKLEKEDMICYSFITKQDKQKSKNRTFKKEHVNMLLDHLDGYDLGDSRNRTPEQLIRAFDAIQKSKLYIGSYCSWDPIARSVFNIPALFMYPKRWDPNPHKNGDGAYRYFEEKWYKYGRP